MAFEEPRFSHIGLSGDRAVIFFELDNGATYSLPINALESAEDWDGSKAEVVDIIHDGYAAVVRFHSGVHIDFPSDFVLHHCEPSYAYHKDRAKAVSKVGARIREIREARGMTLDVLAEKTGIAKPNLSRLEHDKVTPSIETLKRVARGLRTHPVLLVMSKKPERAWTWTNYSFRKWLRSLQFDETKGELMEAVKPSRLVDAFIATRPEHEYARGRLLKSLHADNDCAAHNVDKVRWKQESGRAKASV